MSIIIDVLRSAGAGEQLVIAAFALVAAFYVFKVVKIGQFAGALVSSAAGYGIVILVGSGIAIAAGWVDPNLGVLSKHVSTVIDAVTGWLADLLAGKLEGML